MRNIAIFSGTAHQSSPPRSAQTSMSRCVRCGSPGSGVVEIVYTTTVPIPPEKRVAELQALSVAPALAQAVRRIHNGESVSALFS